MANLALASTEPPFDLVDERNPIFTRARSLPSSRIGDAVVKQSIISDGVQIESRAIIENSIVGIRSQIGSNVTIRNSILMGADMFDAGPCQSSPRLGIGDGSIIENAIVDKNCRIGRNVRIALRPDLEPNCDIKGVYVRDGIIIIPKETTLPDGWVL